MFEKLFSKYFCSIILITTIFYSHSCACLNIFNTTKRENKNTTFICYGDSITYASDLKKDEKWCSLLEKKSKEKEITFINEGKDGRDSHDWSGIIDVMNRNKKADVIIIALGTNDLKQSSHKKITEILSNFINTVKIIRKLSPHIKTIFLGIYNIYTEALTDYWKKQGFNLMKTLK